MTAQNTSTASTPTIPSRQRRPRTAALLGALAFAAPLFTAGCETLAPGQGSATVQRDIYDIKTKLDKSIEDQTTSDRQVKYLLDGLEQNSKDGNVKTTTAIDDLNRQLRTQSDTIDKLSKQVEALNFTIDTLNKRLAMGGSGPDLMASSAAAPANPMAASPAMAGAATPPAGAGLEQIMTNGQRQFNAQNYEAARDAFTQALAQNPQGDNKIEALFWLAESYNKLNDMTNAQKYYTEVIKADSRHPKAWESLEQLGNIILSQGDRERALLLLQQIVDAANSNPPYKYPELDRVKATISRIQQSGTAPATTPATAATPAPMPGAAPLN